MLVTNRGKERFEDNPSLSLSLSSTIHRISLLQFIRIEPKTSTHTTKSESILRRPVSILKFLHFTCALKQIAYIKTAINRKGTKSELFRVENERRKTAERKMLRNQIVRRRLGDAPCTAASSSSALSLSSRSSLLPPNELMMMAFCGRGGGGRGGTRGGQQGILRFVSSHSNGGSSNNQGKNIRRIRRHISSSPMKRSSAIAAAETTASLKLKQHTSQKLSSTTTTTAKASSASSVSSSSSSSSFGPLLSRLNKIDLNDRATILPILGNMGYAALASGFLCTDMLELRVLLVGGYGCLVSYHFLQPKPLTIPLWGSGFFVLVNAVAAGLLVADRYAPSLNSKEHPDGEELYNEHFQGILTRGQFHQLLSLAKREKLPTGSVLTHENQVCDKMYFIVKGQALLFHGRAPLSDYDDSNNNNVNSHSGMLNGGSTSDSRRLSPSSQTQTHQTTTTTRTRGRNLLRRFTTPQVFSASSFIEQPKFATIEQGGFVNDVAFNQGPDVGAYGTVIISNNGATTATDQVIGRSVCDGNTDDEGHSIVLTWDTAKLREHLASRPDLERSMKFCMSDHLVKSLLRQREAAHRRQQQQQQLLQPEMVVTAS